MAHSALLCNSACRDTLLPHFPFPLDGGLHSPLGTSRSYGHNHSRNVAVSCGNEFQHHKTGRKDTPAQVCQFYDVPLVAMRIVRYLLALFFITYFTTLAYSSITGWLVGGGCFILIMVFASTKLMQRYNRMEERFMNNLNSRENTRLGTNNNLVDDMHCTYIQIGQCAPFVGDKIKDSRLRDDYGVSISSIQRGDDYMPLPSPMARIFPVIFSG